MLSGGVWLCDARLGTVRQGEARRFFKMRNKTSGMKKKLIRENRKTRWAPFWAVAKKFNRSMHPARITVVKRNWQKTKIRI